MSRWDLRVETTSPREISVSARRSTFEDVVAVFPKSGQERCARSRRHRLRRSTSSPGRSARELFAPARLARDDTMYGANPAGESSRFRRRSWRASLRCGPRRGASGMSTGSAIAPAASGAADIRPECGELGVDDWPFRLVTRPESGVEEFERRTSQALRHRNCRRKVRARARKRALESRLFADNRDGR